MRKLILAAIVTAALGLSMPALAGPSGSTEAGNEVTCNHAVGASNGGVNVFVEPAGNGVYVGPGGVETCSDDETPLDGRIVVSTTGYIATDGDADNAGADPSLTGCLKIVPATQTTGCTGGNSDN